MFSIFVSSFAPLSPFPTEDLKMTVGIRGPPPSPSTGGRAVDLASVHACSLALVLIPSGLAARSLGLVGRSAWRAFWWLSTVTG